MRRTAGALRAKVTNLEEMLERISNAAAQRDDVPLGALVHAVGERTFGPLLLLAGMVTVSPLSGIPGVPTAMGFVILLVSGQLLMRRRHFWLPQWLLRRSIERPKVERATAWLSRPARRIDHWLQPRIQVLVEGAGRYAIAGVSAALALAMPAMEVVPFSATAAGVALSAFGLALIARDGLLALLAFITTGAVAGLVIWKVLG